MTSLRMTTLILTLWAPCLAPRTPNVDDDDEWYLQHYWQHYLPITVVA